LLFDAALTLGPTAIVRGTRYLAISTRLVRDAGAANSDLKTRDIQEIIRFSGRTDARNALPDDLRSVSNKFFRAATGKSTDFRSIALRNGQTRMQFFSPANNAGYGKLYVAIVDREGVMVARYKDTLGPQGLINRKWMDVDR